MLSITPSNTRLRYIRCATPIQKLFSKIKPETVICKLWVNSSNLTMLASYHVKMKVIYFPSTNLHVFLAFCSLPHIISTQWTHPFWNNHVFPFLQTLQPSWILPVSEFAFYHSSAACEHSELSADLHWDNPVTKRKHIQYLFFLNWSKKKKKKKILKDPDRILYSLFPKCSSVTENLLFNWHTTKTQHVSITGDSSLYWYSVVYVLHYTLLLMGN